MKKTSSKNCSQNFGGCSAADIAIFSWVCWYISAAIEDAGPSIATLSICCWCKQCHQSVGVKTVPVSF